MADLFALVYVSIAAHELSMPEIAHLLEGARRRNAAADVSGVLLYSDGNFMQCLEGPADGLAQVYDIIRGDPLHYGLIEIVREPVARREFAEWTMAFRVVGGFGAASAAHQDEELLRRLAQCGPQDSPARIVLSNFWNRARHATAGNLRALSREPGPRSAPAVFDSGPEE